MFLHLSVILFGRGCVFQHASQVTWADPPCRQTSPSADTPSQMVNERAVRILLECILVFQCEYSSYHVKKLQGILRSKLLNGEGLNVEKRLYIRLPKACVHKFHEIPDPCDPDSKVNISRLLRASMIKTEVRVQLNIWRLLRRS